MSFVSYLINMGIDAALVIVGLVGLLAASSMFFQGNMVLAVVSLLVGIVPLLYTRYRKQKKGITY